ncbi:MAG TPA: archaemetzincin family Zn-dependent metalloprotease [Terriglobales bacterium]|jgi:archaemetzincin|nr:archaemetzincin family Zn-dependent metalloprotease [Terriglobales bacterium]
MKHLQLLPIGKLDGGLLQDLAPALADTFRVPCEVLARSLDPEFAFHGERQQYHSSELLQRMQGVLTPQSWRVLGVASVDLYIPILTFVFGEAQVGGPCAVVSLHRLRQEFYGLPEDEYILGDRLLKEAVHEIGHTLDLTHCDDYRCAMAPSHAVEWIDLKDGALCASCQSQIFTSSD